jgi:hypothetical protein
MVEFVHGGIPCRFDRKLWRFAQLSMRALRIRAISVDVAAR